MEYLKKKHPIKGDNHIQFDEENHEYKVKNEGGYESVTTFISSFFKKFDENLAIDAVLKSKNINNPDYEYYGMSREEISAYWKKNRDDGTELHYDIECFYNKVKRDNENKSIEYQYFLNYAKEHKHLKPWRTELRLYTKEFKICGTIDMLYKNEEGTFDIYDWKRSKKIKMPDEDEYAEYSRLGLKEVNYEKYSLQLNLYKWIIEREYDLKIRSMYIIVFHPNNKNYVKYEIRDLTEIIEKMIEEKVIKRKEK